MGTNAMHLLHCRILASQTAESVEDIDTRAPDTHVYNYDAPEGFESLVGHGLLFMDDWHFDGVVSKVEILGVVGQ
jgi:hypothetical protein